jgi:RNA polymerase sigma-70 factor (ECF subfamily)
MPGRYADEPVNDQIILGLLRQEDPDALAEIVRRYRNRLVSYAARVLQDRNEAEDVAQETFMRVSRAKEIDARGLAGWLYAVTYRLSVDRLRERRVRQAAGVGLEHTAETEHPDILAARREEWQRVQAALSRLEEPYRTAVTLRYVEGLEFKELARRMGSIERTARTWVGRGLTSLRRMLGARDAL